jgi:hypothetical protein
MENEPIWALFQGFEHLFGSLDPDPVKIRYFEDTGSSGPKAAGWAALKFFHEPMRPTVAPSFYL